MKNLFEILKENTLKSKVDQLPYKHKVYLSQLNYVGKIDLEHAIQIWDYLEPMSIFSYHKFIIYFKKD